MLYPQKNNHREVSALDGLWDFRLDPNDSPEGADWGVKGLPDSGNLTMAVPASYNDQSADPKVKDHVGYVWYERQFELPKAWRDRAVALRFDSVTHHATVWINGVRLLSHEGGYLPFGGDIGEHLHFDRPNRVTVRVDNRLTWDTIPPGEIKMEADAEGRPYPIQVYHFDFFNYSGIDRPVRLVATDPAHIETFRVEAKKMEDDQWQLDYSIGTSTQGQSYAVEVELCAPNGETVGRSEGAEGSMAVDAPELWQPGQGILYSVVAQLKDPEGRTIDSYTQETGFRTIEVTPTQFLINGEPFYFTGFGKHEDFHIHGKGLNLPLLVRDFDLLKWIGANSVRTTHYPYSEEFMQMADRAGLVVIDECPAVGQNTFKGADPCFVEGRVGEKALKQHKQSLTELIERDCHHPCVVMWSVANEPASANDGAEAYFEEVTRHTRECDPNRPLTIVETIWWCDTKISKFSDVICLNRYFGWYLHTGHLPLIQGELRKDIEAWHREFNKPVMMTEYGADTVAGMHAHPATMFSEEFQQDFLQLYHEIFDEYDYFIGEHVWNFADFATKQGTARVGGNKKGIFTRERQPKAAARLLKERWEAKAATAKEASNPALKKRRPASTELH